MVVSDVSSPSGVSRVQVPVWCASDQSDIKWYDAEKQGDGTYKATVSMSHHRYATGKYIADTYVTAGNGIQQGTGRVTQEVKLPDMEISAQDKDGKETVYSLRATNVSLLGVVRNVQFATWSVKGGQDDIEWYGGTRDSSGAWNATARISNHKTAGTYQAHAYATLADGSMRFLGAASFVVTEPAITEPLKIVEYDEKTGDFKVLVSGIKSPSGVGAVLVPVWSKSDQSDIKWYEAIKQSDGAYMAKVDPKYHNYNSGTYKIHVYVTSGNGIQSFVGSTSCQVSSTELYTIMGNTTVTVNQMVKYYQSSGIAYPSTALGKGGAPTLEAFCQLYYEEAEMEGVKAEVAFAQAMKETGWLQYGGMVKIEQFNFAGIGALDGNASGNCASFSDVRTGIRAQIQHLKAYASTENLKNVCVDPRFNLVKRGVAPYVEWLGQKENPTGNGWATAADYGLNIVNMIGKMKIM